MFDPLSINRMILSFAEILILALSETSLQISWYSISLIINVHNNIDKSVKFVKIDFIFIIPDILVAIASVHIGEDPELLDILDIFYLDLNDRH